MMINAAISAKRSLMSSGKDTVFVMFFSLLNMHNNFQCFEDIHLSVDDLGITQRKRYVKRKQRDF